MKPLLYGALALLAGAGWAAAQAPAPANNPAPALNYPAPGPANNAAVAPANADLSAAVNCPPAGGFSVYFSADYLLWKVREGNIPPAATAVPVGVIPVTPNNVVTGATGATTTTAAPPATFVPVSILSSTQLGIRSADYGEQNGVRLTGG